MAQNALTRHFQCLMLLLLVAILVIAGTGLYFYFRGWQVYNEFGEKECDQPLKTWLEMMLFLPLIQILLGSSRFLPSGFFPGAYIGLWVLGHVWMKGCKTCQETNPELFEFVAAYLFFIAAVWIFWFTVTIVFVFVFVYALMNGWFETNDAAAPDVVAKIETVAYDPSLFADPKVPGDQRPDGECCCCCEQFGPEKEIKRTKCLHYFHTDCLQKWLKNAKTCPLCRSDLEASVAGDVESGKT